MHACDVEALFFKSLLQAFLLTFVSHHFLNLAAKFGVWATGWDNSILLTVLFAAIQFIALRASGGKAAWADHNDWSKMNKA